MKIFSRSEWGARPPKSVTLISNLPTPESWIHHSAGVPGSDEKAYMRSIQNYHMNHNKWSDIGYSFMVFPSGNIYEGRGWGVVGAHTQGHNSKSHGICFAGNFQNTSPTIAALDACRWLISEGQDKGYIKKGTQPTGGHRDVDSTACPGNLLYAKLDYLRTPWEVKPMYDPPLNINVSWWGSDPNTGFFYILQADGAVYAPEGGYYGGANGQDYFVGRVAAKMIFPGDPEWEASSVYKYRIVSTNNEKYGYG